MNPIKLIRDRIKLIHDMQNPPIDKNTSTEVKLPHQVNETRIKGK